MPKGKGWTALTPDEHVYAAPSWRPDEPHRRLFELPAHSQLAHSRAHVWRFPAGAKGRRHLHTQQEEVFVVLDGTFTMELGEERERVVLPARSVVVLTPNTPIQIFNETDADAVAFMYGVPPVTGDGVILED